MAEQFKNTESVKLIGNWLNDISYGCINKCIEQYFERKDDIYFDYNRFTNIIDRINPYYAFILAVFRFGMPAEMKYFKIYIPDKIIEALFDTGLLRQADKFSYKMPHVCILPLYGMYFITGLPESYPTVERNSVFKPISKDVFLLVDEMNTAECSGKSFLEICSDYGITANIAIDRGFSDIKIQPRDFCYVSLININLALNNHSAEILSDISRDNNKYDYIIGLKSIDIENSVLNKDKKEEDINLSPEIAKLNEDGNLIILLESLGTIHEIFAADGLKNIPDMETTSIVLTKTPYPFYVMNRYQNKQSSWEKKFESYSDEYTQVCEGINDRKQGNLFVFKQLLKAKHKKEQSSFVSYPFYNPKYSDPLYNYASLTV